MSKIKKYLIVCLPVPEEQNYVLLNTSTNPGYQTMVPVRLRQSYREILFYLKNPQVFNKRLQARARQRRKKFLIKHKHPLWKITKFHIDCINPNVNRIYHRSILP